VIVHKATLTYVPYFEKNESKLTRSSCCVRVSVYSPVVARQRLGKHVPVERNEHAKMKKMLELWFPIRICVV
jgi:hypothetical protein